MPDSSFEAQQKQLVGPREDPWQSSESPSKATGRVAENVPDSSFWSFWSFWSFEGAMEKDKAGTGPCCTPTVIPGAAPPRPKLGRGRRIYIYIYIYTYYLLPTWNTSPLRPGASFSFPGPLVAGRCEGERLPVGWFPSSSRPGTGHGGCRTGRGEVPGDQGPGDVLRKWKSHHPRIDTWINHIYIYIYICM